MYTRCPGCHTVHAVNAALLTAGGGQFRCGKCNKVSNALEALFDEWPAAGQQPAVAGEVPVLRVSIDLDDAARARQAPSSEEAGGGRGGRRRGLLRLAWIAAGPVLLVVIAVQILEFQGVDLVEQEQVESAMVKMGLQDPPAREPFRDLDRIHLVTRELRSHPTRPGKLRLSATIVNRASLSQPWPELEVQLLDAAGVALATRRFEPAEYLAAGSDRGAGMTPQAYLPLVLELDDPGERAVSFELAFR
jgi:predicted Zn finger-like uncharacterized protein